VFNAGKEIEAMKRLTLHVIASSLLLPSFGSHAQAASVVFTNQKIQE
jgi:hypothetical protein